MCLSQVLFFVPRNYNKKINFWEKNQNFMQDTYFMKVFHLFSVVLKLLVFFHNYMDRTEELRKLNNEFILIIYPRKNDLLILIPMKIFKGSKNCFLISDILFK